MRKRTGQRFATSDGISLLLTNISESKRRENCYLCTVVSFLIYNLLNISSNAFIIYLSIYY